MQTSVLQANTYFSPMIARVQVVEDVQSYRDPRPDWSLLGTAATETGTEFTKKVPTESDDRDDYSSDSEKAGDEDEVDGPDWRSGSYEGDGARGLPGKSSDDTVFECPTVVQAKPLLSATASIGDRIIAAEPARGGVGASFRFRNDEDDTESTVEEGLKEIEGVLEELDLNATDSTQRRLDGRGPDKGIAVKPSNGHLSGLGGARRPEQNESSDCDSLDDQPKKFYRPNDDGGSAVHNSTAGLYGCDFHSTKSLPPMQIQGPDAWLDQPTAYSIPSQFPKGTEQYFGMRPDLSAPNYPSQAPSAVWTAGYPSRNAAYVPLSNQQQFRPSIVNQPVQFTPITYSFYPESISVAFNHQLNGDVNNGNHRSTLAHRSTDNRPQYIQAPPSSLPLYQQYPVQKDQTFSSLPAVAPVSGIRDHNLRRDTFSRGDQAGTVMSEAVPVTANQTGTTELDFIFEWVSEQPEARVPATNEPDVTRHVPVSPSPPTSYWDGSSLVAPSIVPSYSHYLPISSPDRQRHQQQQPCNELFTTPVLCVSNSSYLDTYVDAATRCNQYPTTNSNGLSVSGGLGLSASPTRALSKSVSPTTVQHPAVAVSPSATQDPRSVSSSVADASPPSVVSGLELQHPADDRLTHTSPGSDYLAMAASGICVSDHGSVTNSPLSLSEDGGTILSGDEPDAVRTAQIAAAQAIADSYQELTLISQDSQGDTPLNVAMIDEQWYLAEALLRRLIRDDLLSQIINVRNKLQQTPLCLAVICNKPEIVETLIENGADVNVHIKASDDYLGTKFCQAVHLASGRGHLWKQTLKKLLRANDIDLDAFNSDGKSALHCAIEGHGRQFKGVRIDCKDTLRMLAERGANLNQPDCGHEKTPLHYAIERRDVELVSRLLVLANNFTPDRDRCCVANMLEARTGNGNTALHLAASVDMDTAEHKKLIQQLMSKGADPSSKNSDGFLPRELTKNQAIVELLKGRTASGRSPNTDKKRNS